ncbi:MAG TPA: SusC/RagA family TonB-linked outer membrane protein, partial [Flavisolibacter sp.]|nr:SusC/RagA family TonB-linked outer membrane protein [Flavisolibacter sp.]
MKLSAFILLIGCLQVSAKGISQQITLKLKEAPLEKLFSEIKKQTGYVVFYDYAAIAEAKKVTVDVKNASVEQLLEQAFKGQPFEFIIEGKTIFVTKKAPEKKSSVQVQASTPPPIDVKGRIVNEEGQPVAASILVKGTQQGTTSNTDGFFELKGVPENATLVISGVGIQTFEVPVRGRTDLAVLNAKIKVSPIDEIQIIGYGQQNRRLATGNVTTVNSQTIEKQPVANVLQALQGQVPGLIVTQSSGFASAPFGVKIRGQNSIAANVNDGINNLSEPLYIVDGVPVVSAGSSSDLNVGINKNNFTGPAVGQSPLYGLNPSDIESISILKDADATAIYGARAANGVVLITTKKGRLGKSTVSANIYSGASLQTRKLKLMNTADYIEMRTRAFANDNITPAAGNAYDLKLWDQNRYTDWQKEFLATAHTTDAQLSLSGGDNQTTYRIGAGLNKTSPPFKGDYREERASGSMALTNFSFNRKLHTVISLNFSSTTSNLPPADLTSLIFIAPNAPSLYDSAGNLNYAGWPAFTFPSDATALKRLYTAATKNMIGSLVLKYQIIPGLDVGSSFGYNIVRQDQVEIAPSASIDPAINSAAFSTFGNNDSRIWVIEPVLNYRSTFGLHTVTTLLGSTFQETEVEGNSIRATGYASDAFLNSMAAAAAFSNPSTNYVQTKFNSVYARINYNYNDKYVVNLNGRRDGSSRFAEGRRFGNFGSVGAAWIFSREKWMGKASNFLSLGKLRASFGLVGGDNFSDYQYFSSFTSGFSPYQGTTAYELRRLANDQFRWTTNKKLEAAILLGFLQDRITTEFSWYRNRSGNQLVSYPLPSLAGFTSVVENLPAVIENKGWELSVQSQTIQTRNLNWST